LHTGLAATCAVVFLAGLWRYPYAFFPFLLWAPLRFRQLGAATAAFVVGALATVGVVHGTVPVGSNSTEEVQILQALIAVVAVALLLVGVVVDERETLSKALRQAQQLTHIGSWEWDISTGRIDWSYEMFRIYGLEPQSRKVDYATFVSIVHPDDRDKVEREVQQAYERVQRFVFEHRVVLPDGRQRLIEARGDVVLDDAGTPVRMVGTGQDMTRQRQLDTLRRDLLATVSHELRTPLTSVLGFALTLKRRRQSLSQEQVDQMIEHIAAQADRLNGLLEDLLDLDRDQRGIATAIRAPVEIEPLLQRIVNSRADGRHEIELETEPLVASVDSTLLDRIVENLLANAIKHTPPGTRIRLATSAVDRDLMISVDDQGPGVPPHQRESIFEIFDRGATKHAAVAGTGIGLAVVAQFAALHGGRAWVEEAAGGGASFRVLLRDCFETPA
jgi:PAS domain S-box-containing protein